jgi:hypothetical protein
VVEDEWVVRVVIFLRDQGYIVVEAATRRVSGSVFGKPYLPEKIVSALQKLGSLIHFIQLSAVLHRKRLANNTGAISLPVCERPT